MELKLTERFELVREVRINENLVGTHFDEALKEMVTTVLQLKVGEVFKEMLNGATINFGGENEIWREVWAGSHLTTKGQMKRRIVRSKTSYVSFIKNQNNKTNVYTNVYDYTEFNEKSKIDSSEVLDRIFLDFDSHNEPMQNSFDDFKTVLGWAIENDYERTMFFSGNGFHMFLFGEVTNDIRDIQYFQKEVVEFLESKISRKSTLDERVCQPTRLRRVPNTVNMKTENFLYCIPLLDSDLDSH